MTRAPAQFIRHITLATCHQRDSRRDEIDDAVIPLLQKILMRIGPDRMAEPIPGMPGYSLSGRISGHCMVASVCADGPPSELLLSFGVARRERCGAAIWRTLHQIGLSPGSLLPPPDQRVAGEYRRSDPDHQPRTPWCAVAMEPAIAGHPDIMGMLGDLERCLAWAFVEMREH